METMIGFARISPTSTPWSPVTSAPNTNAPASAGTRPALLRMVTNMNADAAAVAPRAKDMMAPPIVMNVIPAAMQPITEAVLINAVKLGIDRKPGVKIAQINNPPISIARAARPRAAHDFGDMQSYRMSAPEHDHSKLTMPCRLGG